MARGSYALAPMPVVVVKLGSSVVAEDSGELRLSALARDLRGGRRAARHRDGRRGRHLAARSRAGCTCSGCRVPAGGDRPAAGRVRGRPGPAVPHLRRAAGRARRADRPGAADVLRHERAHALPQRAPHAAGAAGLADRPGDQRERHDDHRRDLLRRQRLPRRAGRGAAAGAAAGPADQHAGRLQRRPAHGPGARRWSPEITDFEALDGRSATRSRRSGRAGCARRSWPPRWPRRPGSRP